MIVGDGGNPASAEIEVNDNARSIYFLHTAAWCSENPASYIVNYADKSKEEIKLTSGKEIADWWKPPLELSNARVAWKGASDFHKASFVQVGAYVCGWENPHPGKRIESIVFKTGGGKEQDSSYRNYSLVFARLFAEG